MDTVKYIRLGGSCTAPFPALVGWGSLSRSPCGLYKEDFALFPGTCFAFPSTHEHLRECLPHDADDNWHLGPIWGLDADW